MKPITDTTPKKENEWEERLIKLQDNKPHLILNGTRYLSYWKVKDLLSQATLSAEERTVREIIELWNEHCGEYSPKDRYWADRFAIKLSQKALSIKKEQ